MVVEVHYCFQILIQFKNRFISSTHCQLQKLLFHTSYFLHAEKAIGKYALLLEKLQVVST